MIEVYKLLQGKYNSDVSNIVKLHKDSDTKEGTMDHSLKLFLECALTSVTKRKVSHLELQNYGMIYGSSCNCPKCKKPSR